MVEVEADRASATVGDGGEGGGSEGGGASGALVEGSAEAGGTSDGGGAVSSSEQALLKWRERVGLVRLQPADPKMRLSGPWPFTAGAGAHLGRAQGEGAQGGGGGGAGGGPPGGAARGGGGGGAWEGGGWGVLARAPRRMPPWEEQYTPRFSCSPSSSARARDASCSVCACVRPRESHASG